MSDSNKYIKGSAREHHFSNGGKLINFSLRLKDLLEAPRTVHEASGDEYVQLTAKQKDEDQYGNTWYVEKNNYQGGGSKPTAPKKSAPKKKSELMEDDVNEDLPF